MELTALINHPEQMDRDTLYELRSLLALYPYFQTARLLLLENLFLLHDPTFDEELRRAAIYITDRRAIFNLVEAAHYKLQRTSATGGADDTAAASATASPPSRTLSLIDTFLDSQPEEEQKKQKRRPTPADAAVDYVAYLLETEEQPAEETPQLRGAELIDSFIESDTGKIVLSETPTLTPPPAEAEAEPGAGAEQGFFTETLARIYIKQGKFEKASEIIKQLSLRNPEKNAYFADQIRFLRKLIVNQGGPAKA